MGYVFNGPIRIHFELNARAADRAAHRGLRGGRRGDRAGRQDQRLRHGRATLVLEVNGLRHPLEPPGFLIGRGTDADLRINDPGISRLHAEIRVRLRRRPESRPRSSIWAPPTGSWSTVIGCRGPRWRRYPDRDRLDPDAGAHARRALSRPCRRSPLTIIKVLYLALLWLFILSAVSVIRSDLFGRTVPAPDRRRAQPLEAPPPPPKKGKRPARQPRTDSSSPRVRRPAVRRSRPAA